MKIYSVTGRKLVEAELWYMDPCHHTDDECLVRVGEKASQSYEELCIVLSNILIRCRPHASIKSGESQYSGNSGMFLYPFFCCCCCCFLFCFVLLCFFFNLVTSSPCNLLKLNKHIIIICS